VPSQVAFFGQNTAPGKFLTHDNLHKSIVVVEWCCMCKKNGEFVDHLLFHCEVATFFFLDMSVKYIKNAEGRRSLMALYIHFVQY
jgi:hypothetical protein